VHHAPYPLFVESGRGAHLTDADGNDYLDFIGNHTAMIVGNCAPEVIAAVEQQLARGTAWAAATRAEAELAEQIVERLPSAERVRFTASGSEAAMLGVRVARAFTSRSLVAKFEGGYHGLSDFAMVSVAPDPAKPARQRADGVVNGSRRPRATARRAAVQRSDGGRASCGGTPPISRIVVERGSAPAESSPPPAFRFPAPPDRQYGILLVFDEVIMRLSYGGAQALLMSPGSDLLGKIIGGGYPIGAVAGRADIMEMFN
jgi:glutamate-1-semialdehyde 2,1-aminomutase